MTLAEKYRPRRFEDVVGQDAIMRRLLTVRDRTGFGGHAFWIAGRSGTGKTTLAELIAKSMADKMYITETVGRQLTINRLREIRDAWRYLPMIGQGQALIVNESHGLTRPVIEVLLDVIEKLPATVVVIFTTTYDGNDLFEEHIDASPFASRCITLHLWTRGLTRPFAERAKMIAETEGLDGKPIEAYERLMNRCGNNLREALSRIESGCML